MSNVGNRNEYSDDEGETDNLQPEELEATCYKKNDQANGAFARDVVKDNKVNENQDNKNDEANGAFAPVVKDNKVNENQDNLPGNPNDQQGANVVENIENVAGLGDQGHNADGFEYSENMSNVRNRNGKENLQYSDDEGETELEATCYNNKNDQANGAFALVVKDNKLYENQDNLPGNPNDQQGGNVVENIENVAGLDEQGHNADADPIGWEWSLIFVLNFFITKATATRNYLVQHPPRLRLCQRIMQKLKNGYHGFRRFCDKCLKIWRQYYKSILGLLVVVLIIDRLTGMIFSMQDHIQTFEEFVKDKNKAYDETIFAQSDYVDNLLDIQSNLRDNIVAVDKSCESRAEQHSGELATMKHSIVEVKDEFQHFMVESQMHMLQLQEKSNANQEQMADMQHNMANEMGSIRDEVGDTRNKLDQMKSSLHSIEFIINTRKNCGFMSRLFGWFGC